MRIISTFNQTLFDTSGRWLLESIREHLDCELLLYTEEMVPIDGARCVNVRDVPEFIAVEKSQGEVIGTGALVSKLEGFNQRWFNWFRKIVAVYDALIRHPYPGISIFLDSDIRIIRTFDDPVVRRFLTNPIGIFRGTREAVETGVVFYDETHPETKTFLRHYIGMFLSGDFRLFPRWDDGYIMSVMSDRQPHLVCDFAAGMEPITHKNSNGHATSGHVIPITPWGEYMEHDKGIHWRKGVAADVRLRPVPMPWYKRWFGKRSSPTTKTMQ